jgi:hypothetical protein
VELLPQEHHQFFSSAEVMSNLEAVEVAETERPEAIELFLKYAKMKDLLPGLTVEIEMIVKELGDLALAVSCCFICCGHTACTL